MANDSPQRTLERTVLCKTFAAAILAGTCLISACQDAPEPAATTTTSVERGEYLVTIAGCNDCHTPWIVGEEGPQPDMTRMLSGHPATMEMPAPPHLADTSWTWVGAKTNTAFAGYWGVSYAMNLTPDSATGMGSWTEGMFVQAIRTGRHMAQSRMILPPMPWPSYAQMTDDDLKAVFAYLRSVPPIENLVPKAIPTDTTRAG